MRVTHLFRFFWMGLWGMYVLGIRPFLSGVCRFHPHCSAYAFEALITHSFFKAVSLIIKRLVRCQPFSDRKIMYDPVPTADRRHPCG